jgi:hypothetical protein
MWYALQQWICISQGEMANITFRFTDEIKNRTVILFIDTLFQIKG